MFGTFYEEVENRSNSNLINQKPIPYSILGVRDGLLITYVPVAVDYFVDFFEIKYAPIAKAAMSPPMTRL